MNTQNRLDTDLIVDSFAYVARKLAGSLEGGTPFARYAQILSEAEKYRGALRLRQRDDFERAEWELRRHTLTKEEFQRLCDSVAQKIALAQQAITRILNQYAPQKLAA